MNLKSILVLLILLALCISTVSANENINSNTTLSDSNVESISSNHIPDIVESSLPDDVLSDSPGNFSALQQLIQNGGNQIELDRDYSYDRNTDSALVTGIVIDKEFTLNGKGYTINGSNLARIFNITGDKVVINNVTLTNGCLFLEETASYSDMGSAIHWTGDNGVLKFSKLVNNYQNITTSFNVYNEGSNFIVDNVTFMMDVPRYGYYCGGLYFTGKNKTIINSTFKDFYTGITGNNTDYVNITGNTFRNLSVKAVLLDGISNINIYNNTFYWILQMMTILNSNIVNCTNNSFGRCSNSNTQHWNVIRDCNYTYVEKNTFLPANTADNAGRWFYIVSGIKLVVSNNNISNSGAGNGGGFAFYRYTNIEFYENFFYNVYIYAGAASSTSFINIEDSNVMFHHNRFNLVYSRIQITRSTGFMYENTFTNHSVHSYGNGLLLASSNSPNFYFENNTILDSFTRNAGTVEGALIISSGIGRIYNNNFVGYRQNNNMPAIYGLIRIYGGTCNITNNNFSNFNIRGTIAYGLIYNQVGGYIKDNNFININCTDLGSCIYNTGDNLVVSNNNFTSSTTGTGVIYNKGTNVKILDNNFTDTHATSSTGVIYNEGNNTLISNNNITNCYSNKDIGAFYISGKDCNIVNNNFINIKAVNHGVIHCENADGTLFSNNIYLNNTASNNDIFSIDSNHVTLNNEKFTNNNATVDAGVISISGDYNELTNVNIENCSAGVTGGAIYNSGVCNNLSNFNISNSKAITGFGGVLYSTGNNLSIYNFNIYNASAARDGGALYISGSYTNISKVVFENITSGYDGGVVYWAGSNGILDDINITNVNATHNGGAIYWSAGEGTISAIKIDNSFAGGDGGAIYWSGDNGNASEVHLFNVSANNGGAIYWTGTYGKLYDSTFEFIRATGDGGAVYWMGIGANLIKINFTNINSTVNGGAVFGTSSYSSFDELTFNDVNASANGGAISWSGADCNLTNLIFNNINARANGGAIYWTGDRSRVKSAKFENITAGGNGGSIYWTGSYSNLSDVNFTNTLSLGSGGSVYWSGINGTVTQANFKNSISNSGGAIFWSADYGVLTNANFTDNNASNNGGAINWIGESPTLYNLNITNNNATFKGGAIYLVGTNSNLTSLYVSHNNAGADGGALYFDGSNSKLFDSVFNDNNANSMGGAILWLGANGEFYNCNFTSNAANIGGAAYIGTDNNNLHKLNFITNNAGTGGALYVAGISGNNLSDANFTQNSASNDGGSIYWTSSDAFVKDININGSSAVDGGAIYWNGDNSKLDTLTFSDSYVLQYGGIMYVSGLGVNVSNANFTDSSAVNGGAIYWTGHDGNLENVTFDKNNVSLRGGALYNIGNNLVLINSNFTNNKAIEGGAIFWAGSGNIIDSSLTNNNATSGSAIYNPGNLNIFRTILLDNQAEIKSIDIETYETNARFYAVTVLRGNDNFLNAIWTSSSNIHVQSVTYLGADGVTTSPTRLVTPVDGVSDRTLYFDSRIAGINATVHIHNENVSEIYTGPSDIYGRVTNSVFKYKAVFDIDAKHDEDLYYTATSKSISANSSKLDATLEISLNSTDIPFNSNVTLITTLVDEINGAAVGLNGTAHLYIGNEFWMDVNIVDGATTISTVIPRNTGDYNLTAYYDGGNFDGHIVENLTSNLINFTIVKAELPINISINTSEVHVGETISINISGPSNYTGKIQYVAGEFSNFTDLNTTYCFNATYLNNGTVHVFVFAPGDDNYLSGVSNLTFNVVKSNLTMKFVDIADINVGDVAVISVEFDVDDAVGNVIVTVDGVDYNTTVRGKYATVNIHNLANGTYNVSASYLGDYYYYPYGNITSQFKVSKITSSIVANANYPLYVGETAVITINVNSDVAGVVVNGFVTATVNNVQYNVSVSDGVGYLYIRGLNKGDYPVNIKYAGDYQFIGSESDFTFRIDKVNTSISVDVSQSPIYVGEDAVFDINVASVIDNHIVNGFVTVSINGKQYNVSISNGKGSIAVSGLTEGVHAMNVSYSGDDEFNANSVTDASDVVVNKINVPYITVVSKPVYVGEDVILNVNLISDVPKYVVNGFVTVTVAGVDYNVSIVDGSGSLRISNLLEGSYPVNLYYPGDYQFNSNNITDVSYISVNRMNIASITVEPKNQIIRVGEDAILKINLTSSVANTTVNSYVTVSINNKLYNVTITDGSGLLNVSGLNSGLYVVDVVFNGDDFFNARSFPKIATVTVDKINITGIKITTGTPVTNVSESVVLNINVTADGDDFNASLNVSVGGENYMVPVTNGRGNLVLSNLLEGNYTVDVNYNGDNIFNPYLSSEICNFTVNKITLNDIDVSVVNRSIIVGDSAVFIVTVDSDKYPFNGYVTLSIGDKQYNVSVSNNKGYLNVSDLAVGDYGVNVTYAGDDQFNSFTKINANTSVVNKVNIKSITVTPASQSIDVGESAVLNIKLAADYYDVGGYVIVSVADVNYTVPIIKNNGYLNVSNLKGGNYSVNVTYKGDYQFNPAEKIDAAKISVNKFSLRNINVSVAESPIYVGDNAVFNIELISDYLINGNVIASINNQNYNVSVINNKATLIVYGLGEGTYTLNVTYAGDYKSNNYTKVNAAGITVKKVNIDAMDVVANSPIYVGQDALFNITLTSDKLINGSVTVSIDNKKYNVSIVNGKGYLKISNLNNGTHDINVTFEGNGQFEHSSIVKKNIITVKKVNVAIDITPASQIIYVGQNATLAIALTPEIRGYMVNDIINITVNGKKYNVYITNNTGLLTLNGLAEGNYDVNASYGGNNLYNSVDNLKLASITVNKVDIASIIVLPVSQFIYVGQNATVEITVNPMISDYIVNDYVTVNVNNKNHNVSIINGKGSFTVYDLPEGQYAVNITYDGNNIFNPKNNTVYGLILVNKVENTIDVNVTSPIYVGQNATVDISVTSNVTGYIVNGYVTLTVNNVEYTVSLINGAGSQIITNLGDGNYSVFVSYAGDNVNKNIPDQKYDYIIVNKVNASVNVAADSPVYVGQPSTLNITMNTSVPGYTVNGYVTVTVDNKQYNVSIINGKGSLTVKDLANGTYDVNVVYSGDSTFNSIADAKYGEIKVNKIPTTITMGDITINVGDTANIQATINNKTVTGNVIFIVDNKNYTAAIVNGVARLNVTGLNTSANKTVTAIYSGDSKFINSSATAHLNINKVNGNVKITVHNITAGESETVIIKLPKDITNATIIVKFNNIEVKDYRIDNNVISFDRTIQVSGEYEVSITVSDDCKYNDFTNSSKFTVSKVSSDNYTIVISANDTHVFENIPVVITLPNDANETLQLSIDDNTTMVNVVKGIATYNSGNLSYGNHTIKVTYGNDKYDTKTVSANIFVSKIASSISIITPEDARVAQDIIIKLIPEGSTGNISVTINNKEYPVENRSSVNASDLLEGNYTVVVKLDGDDNYIESSSTDSFIVRRNNAVMTIDNVAGEIFVDSPVTVRADFTENVTGSVIFNINGRNYTVNITESDHAEYTWIPSEKGFVIVTATYSGNDTYYPCTAGNFINFEVVKNPVKITDILVEDIMVGDVENITLALNATDVTGVVIIDVNGTQFESNVMGGLAYLNIPDLSAGNYKINVYYPGDSKYAETTPVTADFTVSKHNSPIEIIAEDIMVFDNESITINLPDEINDLITVTIGDETFDTALVNGTVSIPVNNLPADEYDITVNYKGNGKYLANTSTSTLTVHKYNSTFNTNVSDIFWTYDENTISADLSHDATGSLTVSINGTNYSVPVVNGHADFKVPELLPGDYEAIVTYNGNDKYDAVSKTSNFTVVLNNPIIESDDIIKYYKGSERLYINLTNVRGDKLANENIKISVNGVDYIRTTNENGSCSLPINLLSGEYEVLIVHNSSNYGVVNKTVNAKVTPTIISNDLVKVYRNSSQFYAYFTDSQGNALTNTLVTFNINGVFYNRTTNASGWAKLNINLPQGEYIITSYNWVTGETCSNKINVISKITENEDIVMHYRDGTRYTACIIGEDGNNVGAGENVTFNINGVFYTRATNATGYVGLNINLPEGEYIITAYYKECVVSNRIVVLPKM